MIIKESILRKIIRKQILSEWPEALINDPEVANKLAQYEQDPMVMMLAELFLSFLPITGELIAAKDFIIAVKEDRPVSAGFAALGLVSVGAYGLVKAASMIRKLQGAGKLSKKVMVVAGNGDEVIDLKQLLIEAKKDPVVKKAIEDGFFVKIDIAQPSLSSAKPRVDGIGARVPLGGLDITYEILALDEMSKALGKYSIDLAGDIHGVAKVAGKERHFYIMEMLPGANAGGDTLVNKIFDSASKSSGKVTLTRNNRPLNKDLTYEKAHELRLQMQEIRDLLKQNKDTFVHGDLHMNNIWVGPDNQIKIFDPSGAPPSPDLHTNDIERVNGAIAYLMSAEYRLKPK